MNATVSASDEFGPQYNVLIQDIRRGLLVPVLGGDINLCGRPIIEGKHVSWEHGKVSGKGYPPSTCELASHLLKQARTNKQLDGYLSRTVFRYIDSQLRKPHDSMAGIGLASVSEYVKLVDPHILDGLLPELLAEEYRPTPVHEFLVKLAQYKPDRGVAYSRPYPCIVTACFDQVLEQQLRINKIPFHLVTFVLSEKGGFFHYTPPGSKPESCSEEIKPEQFNQLMESLREHAVVIKLNGGIGEGSADFAITEDHYIDYLNNYEIRNCLPEMLAVKLTALGKSESSHLLFLGFSLRHWNHRVLLRRIWSENLRNQNKRWSVVMEQDFCHIDRKFWSAYGLQDLSQVASLNNYIEGLTARLECLPERAPSSAQIATAPSKKPLRDTLFVSYSHEDDHWFRMLLRMLEPISERLNIWHDQMIKPGADWREEIKEKLASAKAAILLVSNAFLKSDFIRTNELPELLKAAESNGCILLWIQTEKCLVHLTPIGKYHALHTNEPLSKLNKKELEDTLFEIANEIASLLLEKADES